MNSRRLVPITTVLVFAFSLGIMTAAVAADSQDQPEIISLTSQEGPAAVQLLEKGHSGVVLKLTVPAISRSKTSLAAGTGQTQEFDSLKIQGAQLAGADGQPALPVISRLVALPAGMTLEVNQLQQDKMTLEGNFRPVPAQGLRASGSSDVHFDADYYNAVKSASVMEKGLVRIGEPALIRGQRVVSVNFHPVTWDPATGDVAVTAELTADLAFVPSADGNNPRSDSRPIPESFVSLYNETVLGYERGAGQESTLGTWLMIYPAGSAYTVLQPLADWRQRQGYNVVVASTSTTGASSSAIKEYIQDQYDNLEIPLEFVTLVGDANGALTLASYRESQSGYGGEGDHEYTRLEGNDVLADIHLGRLSATSTTELANIVNKIVSYESDPHMSSDLGWYTRAGLTGDPGSSGQSTIWVNQWVKEQLEELHYTQIDTIWGGNFLTAMMTTINQGESIFTYRGYWGMSGMNTGHIASLSNGQKLPFALILTCDTGSFWDDTTCNSEAFLRAANGGGIASIGTATIGTHTRYNNCMFQGVAEGVLNSGDPRVGPGLTRGKLSMYENYIEAEPNTVAIWSTWNNLMGDPATAIWSAVPADLTVDYPANLSVGANAIPVTVTSGGQPVAGARVAVFMKDQVAINGLTDDSGHILLPLASLDTGNLLVTVTGRNLRPHLGGANVGTLDLAVDFSAKTITDDGSGNSMGNGDSLAAPGETLEVDLQLVNSGTGGAADVSATIVDGQYGISVLQSTASFGYMASGATAWGDQPLLLSVDQTAMGGHEVQLELLVTSGSDQWTAVVPLVVHGAAASVDAVTVLNAGNGMMDPGEVGDLRIDLRNVGNLATSGVTATLTSESQWVSVIDGQASFGYIPVDGTGANSSDLFSISAAADCYPGHLASLTLELAFAEGGSAMLEFQIQVGQASSTDPVGPDAYGYLAFDNTDTSYDLAPTYDWVEIDPGQGGSGSNVGLGDFARYDDDTRTISLPFSFGYYGQDFDEISICSNGWIAMGQTYVKHYRNWTIPSPGGPDNMIAVFWDDLYQQSGTGGVFYWHDTVNHRFIVEWSQVRNYMNNVTETFQVMLYDPAYLAGDSGDGVIVAQYHTVNQSDWENGYATAGIQNEDRNDGVLYTYWDNYPGGGAELQSGRAIAYRTVEAQIQGVLKGAVTNASGGDTPIDGASINLLGSGRTFMTSVAGLYQGGAPIGTYDVAVSHPSFAPDTTFGVTILEATETVVDFALTDIGGPAFALTSMPENSDNTTGPYQVAVDISDYSGLAESHFYYTSSATGGPFELPLTPAGGDSWTVEIPGQPMGSRIQYWVTAVDNLGHAASEPAGAPFNVHSFVITSVSEIYATEMETEDGWTGGISGDTAGTGIWERVDPNGVFDNSTEVQPEDDHTVSGTMCWITGNDPEGSGQGADDVDGGLTTLESPTFDINGMSGLEVSYFRWYTNDTGQSPGEDYWRVQVSNGSGVWATLEETSTSARSWQERSFLLEDHIDLTGQVLFRFLAEDAGSGSVVEAGLDDFTLMGYNLPGDSGAPDVSLTSFIGGENVAINSTVAITWNQSDDIGVVQTEILLSTDSGANFDQVIASGPYNGSFDWMIDASASTTCRLKVICHDSAGNSTEVQSGGDFTIRTGAVPVEDVPAGRLTLAQNAPNPFNPRTEIKFNLPSEQNVSLKIYNVEGRLVKTLVTGRQTAGNHTIIWSGKDERDSRVASGLYFYRLTTDSGVLTRKMTLLK